MNSIINLIVQYKVTLFFRLYTGIPRLPRFLVTRFHFARIFEAEFLYYKINIFLTIFFGYTMIHIARISRNAVFCLPQKTRQPRDDCKKKEKRQHIFFQNGGISNIYKFPQKSAKHVGQNFLVSKFITTSLYGLSIEFNENPTEH